MHQRATEESSRESAATETALQRLGITYQACGLRLPSVDLTIGAAAVLAAVAGPELWLETPFGPKKFGGINVAFGTWSPAYCDLIGCLTGRIEMVQRDLVRNAGAYDRGLVSEAVRGTSGKAGGKKNTRPARAAAESEVFSMFQSRDYGVAAELPGKDRVTLQEAVLNPKILITEKGIQRQLAEKIAVCHQHSALVVIEPSSKDGGTLPELIREILDLDHGVGVPRNLDRGLDLPVTARFVMAFDPSDQRAAAAKLYRRFLFLSQDGPVADAASVQRGDLSFPKCFTRAVEALWELRRKGELPILKFHESGCRDEFLRGLRGFEEVCTALGGVGQAVLGLPAAIMLLFRHLADPSRRDIPEMRLVSACFEIAAVVLREHQAMVSHLLCPALDQEISDLASRLLQELMPSEGEGDKGGRRFFSTITKTFSKPQRKKAEIIISEMTARGVVIFNGDKTYELGSVPMESVRAELLRNVGAKLLADF
jgi:hypothetical protein